MRSEWNGKYGYIDLSLCCDSVVSKRWSTVERKMIRFCKKCGNRYVQSTREYLPIAKRNNVRLNKVLLQQP